MLSNISLRKKGMLLVLIPLAFEVLFISSIAFFVWEGDRQSADADREVALTRTSSKLSQTFIDSGFNLIILGMTKSKKAEREFDAQLASIPNQQAEIKKLLADNPKRLAAFEQSDSLFQRAAELSIEVKDSFNEGLGLNALNIFAENSKHRTESFELMGRINTELSALSELGRNNKNLIVKDLKSTESALRILLGGGIALNIVLAVAAALAYRSNLVLRLNQISENCEKIEQHESLHPVQEGSDEISELDRRFHAMAAELKEAARREKAVVEDAVDVICSIGEDGVPTSMNKSGEALWGYTRRELLSLPVTSLVVPDERDSLTSFLSADLSTSPPPAKTSDFRALAKDGRTVETRWSVRFAAKERTAYCVVRDVTLEKETEKLKAYFVAMVTHDLRTPLNSVHNMLSMIETGVYGDLPGGAREIADASKRTCENLIKVISDFLDLEKMDSQAYVLNKTSVDFSSILDNLCDLVEDGGITPRPAIILKDQTRGLVLEADSALMQSCLLDVAVVLLKHTPDSETLKLTLRSGNGTAYIQFEGSRCGNLAVTLEKPFRELFESKEPGIEFEDMLKLSRARAAVLLHGGQISVTGDQESTTLSIILPDRVRALQAVASS